VSLADADCDGAVMTQGVISPSVETDRQNRRHVSARCRPRAIALIRARAVAGAQDEDSCRCRLADLDTLARGVAGGDLIQGSGESCVECRALGDGASIYPPSDGAFPSTEDYA